MGNPLGVYETMYKLKNEEKVFLKEIWLASQNVRTRVSLLYLETKLQKMIFFSDISSDYTLLPLLPESAGNI